jgi:hypothetical protein
MYSNLLEEVQYTVDMQYFTGGGTDEQQSTGVSIDIQQSTGGGTDKQSRPSWWPGYFSRPPRPARSGPCRLKQTHFSL